jgi:hypothetical protein
MPTDDTGNWTTDPLPADGRYYWIRDKLGYVYVQKTIPNHTYKPHGYRSVYPLEEPAFREPPPPAPKREPKVGDRVLIKGSNGRSALSMVLSVRRHGSGIVATVSFEGDLYELDGFIWSYVDEEVDD